MSTNHEFERESIKANTTVNKPSNEKIKSIKEYCDGLECELGIRNPIYSEYGEYTDDRCLNDTKESYYLSLACILGTLLIIKFPMLGVGGVLGLTVLGALGLNRSDISKRDYQKKYNDRITEVAGISIVGSILTLLTGNEWPLLFSFYIGLYRGIDGFIGMVSDDAKRKSIELQEELKERLTQPTPLETKRDKLKPEIRKTKYDI